jgi:arginine decarboxylase
MRKSEEKTWSPEKSADHYNIENWGSGYFGVNPKGNLCIFPYGKEGPTIDIMDVIEDIQEKKLGFPCVVRFQDILRSRVEQLNETFRKYIQEYQYQGKYYGVYPIKVNQLCEVVEEILDAGKPYHFGLEAGSKGELLTVLAFNQDPEALTVCNGYKDEGYLRLALIGRKLGRKVVVVIEKFSELPLLIKIAEEMGVSPWIGFRAKLTTRGTGRWENSGGDFAKFGLTVPEIMQATQLLKNHGKEEWLKLFHFHVGSQLTDIRLIKESVREGARIYAKLHQMGFPIKYFDVGGGLGVDYDGSQTASDSSMNYSMREYVEDIVYNLQQVCEEEQVPQPNITSESGRALVAHHSCIIIPVFGHIEIGRSQVKLNSKKEEAPLVGELKEIAENLNKKNLLVSFHDAQAKKEEALSGFKLGILDLEDRAKAESLYWQICRRIVQLQRKLVHPPEDTADLRQKLANQYLANFSLFQTAPDHWAFGQLFPVVPLHRLDEKPERECTIVDITCDSDGKIDRFIDLVDVKQTVSLHALEEGKPYYIGMFLIGGYQDIMGDMHNLFGRVHEVHVFCDDEDPEDYYLEEVIRGDTARSVLSRLQYSPADLVKSVKTALDREVRQGNIKPKDGVRLIDFYQEQMDGYTYLHTDGMEEI